MPEVEAAEEDSGLFSQFMAEADSKLSNNESMFWIVQDGTKYEEKDFEFVNNTTKGGKHKGESCSISTGANTGFGSDTDIWLYVCCRNNNSDGVTRFELKSIEAEAKKNKNVSDEKEGDEKGGALKDMWRLGY